MPTIARCLACCVFIAILGLQAMPLLAQDEVPASASCHICCCLGNLEQAKNYVQRVEKLIPGVKARIEERNVEKAGAPYAVYDVYVKHDELSLEEICGRLLELRQEFCPDSGQETIP